MSQAEALYRLQQIDLDILKHRKRLDTIATALDDDEAVAQAHSQVEAAQASLAPLRAKMRDLELEIQTNNQKAKATEDRLYSGNIKNPKELQDLQQESTALKKWNDTLEERLLEQMLAVEEAEAELGTREANLGSVTAAWEAEHVDLLAEQATLESELETLQAQRQTARQVISEDDLKRYNTLRKKKANQPIAPLQGRSCGVCGMEQTAATEREARRGQELVYCENCGRILADVR